MTEAKVRAAFKAQATACADLGSPFMARLMTLCAERLTRGTPVSDRILDWPGDPMHSADSVPLRLAGALHALKIEGIALTGVYPPQEVSDDALWTAVTAALGAHAPQLLDWLSRAPQTNEVRRSAVLLPALAELNARFGLPVHLMELGCSGGLNLRADRFYCKASTTDLGDRSSDVRLAPDWAGPAPKGQVPEVVGRRGVDVAPVDPTTDDGRLKLLAYLWPDQPERITRTEAAIAISRGVSAEIDRADAGAWLDVTLPSRPEGALTVIFHTVAWQYFPQATAERARIAIGRAGAAARTGNPMAQIAMEADGGRGAGLSVTLWPDGTTFPLGRADFHGRWIDWQGLPEAL